MILTPSVKWPGDMVSAVLGNMFLYLMGTQFCIIGKYTFLFFLRINRACVITILMCILLSFFLRNCTDEGQT
jgi:hypothetical protein